MLFNYYSLQTTNSYTLLYTQLKREGKLEVSFLLFAVCRKRHSYTVILIPSFLPLYCSFV